jgi:gluconolactonase
VERIWTGSRSADGIVGAPDGSLLFTEQDASRISRLDAEGKVSVYLEDTNGAGALAIDSKGRVIAVERLTPQLRVLAPDRTVLANGFEGEPLEHLSDLVADKKNGLYFTDGRNRRNSRIYYVKPDGRLTVATEAVEHANGVMLSPDEKTLYVSNTPFEFIVAFDVRRDGTLENQRKFGRLEGGQRTGADGLAIDAAGRLYVASPVGVQVFTAQGQHLGTIATPRPATSVAFAGAGKKTLYVVGRGNDGLEGGAQWARSIYKISMLARGLTDRAK